MPIYQYQCRNCKLQFELRQSFKDKPMATCPACHGTGQRMFIPVPILFKGPGFYITDSRAEKESKFDSEGLRRKEREMDKGGQS